MMPDRDVIEAALLRLIGRKGKMVDPRDFKGVYRLTTPRQD